MNTITDVLQNMGRMEAIGTAKGMLGQFESVGFIKRYGRAGRYWLLIVGGPYAGHSTHDSYHEAKDALDAHWAYEAEAHHCHVEAQQMAAAENAYYENRGYWDARADEERYGW